MKWSAALVLSKCGETPPLFSHSSSPSWPALAQDFRWAKKTLPLAPRKHQRGTIKPRTDSGNVTGPDTHQHTRFYIYI